MGTIVFDLDGTLVDALPDFTDAMNRLMAAMALTPVTGPEIAGYLGDGPRVLVERVLTARGKPMDESAHAAFLTDYTAHAAEGSLLFPNVTETLEELAKRGWRLAVCTNKPAAATEILLLALDIRRFFATVSAGDSHPFKKPDPRHLLAALAGETGRSIMVGDHRNDVQAALGAGVPCIFAGWGYGKPEMAAGATAVAGRFADVVELAETL
ncbi:HAD-IA family hydrolase [Lacibacterium aquatile]|uniref:phosphoglycolate phosphatase n=1 Tax=Lacibacterium aquatile TaxID=1168082 RepID=A0ABW5DYK5_9PROT